MYLIFHLGEIYFIKAIKNGKVLLATNIYFLINIYVSVNVMIVASLDNGYSEYDKSIIFVICIMWIIHSFNLIPGKIVFKIALYIFGIFAFFLIAQPKAGYGK